MPSTKLVEGLNKYFLQRYSEIEDWFAHQEFGYLKTNIFYCSVDLRNGGAKIAPVDTNLFPAGFNNLSSVALDLGVAAVKKWFSAKSQCIDGVKVKKILLIPENHTRNMPYYENVAILCDILRRAGFEVRVGSLLLEKAGESKSIICPKPSSRREVILEALWRKDDMLGVGGGVGEDDFLPEMILLNNDLSEGVPEILQNLKQITIPSFAAGWFNRKKSIYFQHYREVSSEFAEHFGFDVWQIAALFDHCEDIDFMRQSGMENVAEKVAQLLQSIQNKYFEYGITYKPFVMMKTDAGSYGMSVMNVDNAAQLQKLNRRQRTHMATTKGGRAVHRVIIQEGVYTTEFLGANNAKGVAVTAAAEPVMCLLGSQVIGGFYRVNANRGDDQNLNGSGMQFTSLNNDNKFYNIYRVIALLAQLAAARELESYLK